MIKMFNDTIRKKLPEYEQENFWNLVENVVLESHNGDGNVDDDIIYEVIEEMGSSISKRSVWEQIRDLAEEVLENASLEE